MEVVKKLFVAMAFVISAIIPSYAQSESGFEPTIKIVGTYGIDYYKNKSFGAEFIASYRTNSYFRIGVGTGISWCNMVLGHLRWEKYRETDAFVPLYVNAKINFINHGVSPYFSANAGYTFLIPFSGWSEKTTMGFMLNPAFGVDFPLRRGSIFLELGYKFQMMNYDSDVDPKDSENLDHHQITFAVGYNF